MRFRGGWHFSEFRDQIVVIVSFVGLFANKNEALCLQNLLVALAPRETGLRPVSASRHITVSLGDVNRNLPLGFNALAILRMTAD
jgi:hypothetical protein